MGVSWIWCIVHLVLTHSLCCVLRGVCTIYDGFNSTTLWWVSWVSVEYILVYNKCAPADYCIFRAPCNLVLSRNTRSGEFSADVPLLKERVHFCAFACKWWCRWRQAGAAVDISVNMYMGVVDAKNSHSHLNKTHKVSTVPRTKKWVWRVFEKRLKQKNRRFKVIGIFISYTNTIFWIHSGRRVSIKTGSKNTAPVGRPNNECQPKETGTRVPKTLANANTQLLLSAAEQTRPRTPAAERKLNLIESPRLWRKSCSYYVQCTTQTNTKHNAQKHTARPLPYHIYEGVYLCFRNRKFEGTLSIFWCMWILGMKVYIC